MKYPLPPYTLRELDDVIYRRERRKQAETIKVTVMIVVLLLIIFALLVALLSDRARTPETPAPRPAVQRVQPVRPEVEEGLEPSDLRTQPQG